MADPLRTPLFGTPVPGSAAARRRGLLSLHAAVLLVGTSSLFGKWIGVGAVSMVFGRLVFAVPALALVLRTRGPGFALPPGRVRWLVVLNGLVLCAHWVAFFHAVKISTVAIPLLGYSAAPVFAVLLEPLWFRERFAASSLGAAGLIVAGMACIVENWSLTDSLLQGMLGGLIAGLLFAVLQLNNRRLLPRIGSTRLAFYLDLTAFLALVPLVLLAWETPSAGDVALMAIQGLLFTAVSHTLFIHALHSVQAQVVAMVSTLEPIYGILLAAWLLGEIPSERTLLGGALILAAVGWVTLRQSGWRLRPRTGQ